MRSVSDKVLSTIVLTGFGLGLVPGILFQSQNIASKFSHKAKTEQEAYTILNQEAKKLHINRPVKLVISESNAYSKLNVSGCAAQDSSRTEYIIGINKNRLDRILLRHELYHIYSVGSDLPMYSDSEAGILSHFQDVLKAKKERNVSYSQDAFVKYEAPAYIYAVTGIRLNRQK